MEGFITLYKVMPIRLQLHYTIIVVEGIGPIHDEINEEMNMIVKIEEDEIQHILNSFLTGPHRRPYVSVDCEHRVYPLYRVFLLQKLQSTNATISLDLH